MIETPVIWMNLDPDSIVRGYWDQGLLERIFAGDVARLRRSYRHVEVRDVGDMPPGTGAIVVLPGRFHVDRVDDVNRCLSQLGWVVLIVSSDEESLFPIEKLVHPRLRLWVMTPDPTRVYDPGIRFVGEYFESTTPETLAGFQHEMAERSVDVAFLGQITHPRRERFHEAILAMQRERQEVVAIESTKSFAAGVDRDEYLRRLANTKVAPAPAGPATADSFRIFEALEAGCVPIADARAEGKPEGYWDRLFVEMFGDRYPFPVLDDWSKLAEVARPIIERWPFDANLSYAWWQRYKRNLVVQLEADVDEISDRIPGRELADLITVIIPTSPIPSNPALDVIVETIDSVRYRLPGAEIVVVCDGVREEQDHRRWAYEEFKRRLLTRFNFDLNIVPIVLTDHVHQANATRVALDWVRTPLVLFVEHDTPLVGEIPFDKLADVLIAGEANVIRLHHEASVLEPHRHLMIDEEPRDVMGVPLLGTVQWSQRPHLSTTTFYRQMIRRYFGHASRTMIEDVMHGVVQTAAREGGWGMFRVFMYAPDGDIKRSTHLDGRGDDPKFDDRFVIEYDGDVPDWAPRPTSERVAAAAADRQPGTPDDGE